jgi:UDP-N-acetylmuramyl pentapeptide phosphotransferase/UDP-N-acetylglucosamine-1-phosphate transferase
MDLMSQGLLFVVVGVAVFATMGALLPFLHNRAILDHPNERSSHEIPTPKGGGIAVVAIILLAWIAVGLLLKSNPFFVWVIPIAALVLAVFSWIDDLRGLPPVVRLLAQVATITAVLILRPEPVLYFRGLLPPLIDGIIAGLLWVWFINLFNFMDGIDGITGVESLVIGIGIWFISGGEPAIVGLVIASAALGFLKWNWHPAKVFMGDVGSVPLGFLLGWLLLDMASSGNWAPALILPGYYLADAGITLTRRAFRGEKIWQAHRQHFYQQAVQHGLSHASVSGLVFVIGMILIALAWAAEAGWTLPALIIAIVLSLGFLRFLAGARK